MDGSIIQMIPVDRNLRRSGREACVSTNNPDSDRRVIASSENTCLFCHQLPARSPVHGEISSPRSRPPNPPPPYPPARGRRARGPPTGGTWSLRAIRRADRWARQSSRRRRPSSRREAPKVSYSEATNPSRIPAASGAHRTRSPRATVTSN
jgi:hypothetical protein